MWLSLIPFLKALTLQTVTILVFFVSKILYGRFTYFFLYSSRCSVVMCHVKTVTFDFKSNINYFNKYSWKEDTWMPNNWASKFSALNIVLLSQKWSVVKSYQNVHLFYSLYSANSKEWLFDMIIISVTGSQRQKYTCYCLCEP